MQPYAQSKNVLNTQSKIKAKSSSIRNLYPMQRCKTRTIYTEHDLSPYIVYTETERQDKRRPIPESIASQGQSIIKVKRKTKMQSTKQWNNIGNLVFQRRESNYKEVESVFSSSSSAFPSDFRYPPVHRFSSQRKTAPKVRSLGSWTESPQL